jgi:aryl-alcohol dehydrogenase-like predicted oxidoreductase
VERRTLGSQGLSVPAPGLGCMGMTYAYGTGDERLRHADAEMALLNQ